MINTFVARITGFFAAILVAVSLFAIGAASMANASETVEFPDTDWSFSGPFGSYDQAALRRGLLVYIDTCWSCHSIRQVAYRNLSALGVGYGPEDIKALAADFDVMDGPDENGEMFLRPARPSDRFAPPFFSKAEAQRQNKGMYPPDLSLMTKARVGGPDFLYALLVGYSDPPAGEEAPPGMYYNPYVAGSYSGMKSPLVDGLVDYDDGTEATVAQMASDVTHFLTWAADPHMEARKSMGWKAVVFLVLLTIMFIALKMEVWAHLKTPPQPPEEKPNP
jgi:ubiquinol-cytochrome c reductase cytochrome c1 subunit